MKTPRIKIAQNEIIQLLNEYPFVAFSKDEIYQLLKKCRKSPIKLPKSLSLESFLIFLTDTKLFQPHHIHFPILNKTYLRYTWGNFTLFDLCASISRKAYFTHGTAMYIHGLTAKKFDEIYINIEQSAKLSSGTSNLSQESIDMAFSRPQRETTRIGSISNPSRNNKIFLLNGKQTKRLDVIEVGSPFGKSLPVTSIERTLIDIVVRPKYAGGLDEIIAAYKLARNQFSIDSLVRILRELSYVYPYHQAIGFLLDKTGAYEKTDLEPLKALGLEYNFYLDRQIMDLAYSKEWKLYYPKSLS